MNKAESRMTAILKSQVALQLEAAMDHLLHDLRKFMMAYPRVMGAEMPDRDLVWHGTYNNGPAQTILAAIRANPVLWTAALPDEVCIVPRKALEASISSDLVSHLDDMGKYVVATHAARYHREKQQAERQLA